MLIDLLRHNFEYQKLHIMSINSNKIPHIIAVAVIYTYSFLKCARLYLSYGTNLMFALLCFACHFLILAAISLTILYVYQWTKKKYNYFVLNWPPQKSRIHYPETNCLLIESHDYPVTKNTVEPQIIEFMDDYNKPYTNTKSQATQPAQIQYIKNDIAINQNLTIINADTSSKKTDGFTIESTDPSYSNPVTDSQAVNNKDEIKIYDTINKNNSDQQISIEDIDPYIPYKRRNKCKDDLETLYYFTLHYLGAFLDENGKTVMKEDLKEFSTKVEPKLKPIPLVKSITYHKYDILSICHAIGHHTFISKDGNEIAMFASACFPEMFRGDTIENMKKKTGDGNIDLFDKNGHLPKYHPIQDTKD